MAGKQRDVLEQKARGLLSGMGMTDLTVDEPPIGRPGPARLEIVHPQLAEYRRSERWEQIDKMNRDGAATAVMSELAQMTRCLRQGGIRATADYGLGIVVVSWGAPPDVDLGEVRRRLVAASGGQPVSDESVLVTWAGLPGSELDALGLALQEAMAAISPAARTPRSDGYQAARPGDPSWPPLQQGGIVAAPLGTPRRTAPRPPAPRHPGSPPGL